SLSAKLQEFDRLRSTAPADPQSGVIREQRLAQLQSELGPLLAGGDDAAGALFRARVTASTEPIGRFALANSFAGLLLVGLLLAGGQLLRATAALSGAIAVPRWRVGTGALLVIGMAYCFWLTKS